MEHLLGLNSCPRTTLKGGNNSLNNLGHPLDSQNYANLFRRGLVKFLVNQHGAFAWA